MTVLRPHGLYQCVIKGFVCALNSSEAITSNVMDLEMRSFRGDYGPEDSRRMLVTHGLLIATQLPWYLCDFEVYSVGLWTAVIVLTIIGKALHLEIHFSSLIYSWRIEFWRTEHFHQRA